MHYITGVKVITTTTEQQMYHLLQSISSMLTCVFGVFRVTVVRPCVVRTRFLSLDLKTEIWTRVWTGPCNLLQVTVGVQLEAFEDYCHSHQGFFSPQQMLQNNLNQRMNSIAFLDSFPSSSAFLDCPQTSSFMVLAKLVVSGMSSFEPQALQHVLSWAPELGGLDEVGCLYQVLFRTPELFCKHGSSGASAVSMFPCVRGRTAEDALGFVDLSHVDSQLCVADQGAVTGS